MIRTLVVEDDALVAEVHASYVERVPGFAVAGVAHRATEALELLAARPVDLVLLDFHLPDVKGLDMLRILHARTAAPVDVIAVTAARDPESIRQAIAHGVSQYLVKPFAFATFADKLERYARYRAQVEHAAEPVRGGRTLRPVARHRAPLPRAPRRGRRRHAVDALRRHRPAQAPVRLADRVASEGAKPST